MTKRQSWQTAIASVIFGALASGATDAVAQDGEIARDAEFYILEEQNRDRWAQEDEILDAALTEFRDANGGKPPNIF